MSLRETPHPIDEQVLLQLRKDFGDADGALGLEPIAAFNESADMFELSCALPEAIEQSSLEQRAQHLRGAAVMVGAQHVARLCQHVEAAAKAADREAIESCTADLSTAITVANAALARLFAATQRAG